MTENYIQTQETPRNYFTMLPNLVDDLDLDPYEFRLYCHLRRVSGERGACWQSTATLAEACKMSAGKVSQAKQKLATVGLIAIEERRTDGGINHVITVADIWEQNSVHQMNALAKESVHQVNANAESVHQMNAERSPGETKKNPSKKNHEEKDKEAKPVSGDDGALRAQPPDFLPDLFALSITEIKVQQFAREQYQAIFEAERARGDAARRSLLKYIEQKLSLNNEPAIVAFRDETHYYPQDTWKLRIVEQVGRNGKVDLWRQVVAAYVGLGWNPRNVKAMLEWFERGEIPTTTPATPRPKVAPRLAADEAAAPDMATRLEKLKGKPKWTQ